ncbi:MAG TPA: efflux RND transporter periplasmic adaptor subunit [Rudaea sp.]|jgi:membrane fusion protein (multidrug efflux system)|nr:efflux RND transporter periplasmic adaptor subunit [Rudaea sp.]
MSTPDPLQNPPVQQPARKGKRRIVLTVLALIFVVIAVVWVLLYVFVFSLRETTDDAYVNGNQVVVSSQVTGTVVALLADDTQLVEAGQVLVKLDPTDADLALSRAQSTLAQAVRQVRQQTHVAGQYDATVAARREDVARAQADLDRREPLLAERAVAPEDVAHARQALTDAKSALDAAERQAAASHALVDGTDIAGNPTVLEARAAFREAWVNSHRNAIVAPASGYVAQRSVQIGSRVQPGQALLTIVPLHDLWIDANFKEVQLGHIRIDQPVEVTADLYGGKLTFHGRVEGLAAGTGGAFALLPAQNASGNWIKVVQRVPVRIALDPKELEKNPLRVGLSTDVAVDTHERGGQVLARTPASRTFAKTDVYSADLASADAAADSIVQANLGKP